MKPDRIKSSNKALRVTAANLRKGVTQTFDNADLRGEDAYDIITAAMLIPGAMGPTKISLEEYVDGAMLMKSPLQPAIATF